MMLRRGRTVSAGLVALCLAGCATGSTSPGGTPGTETPDAPTGPFIVGSSYFDPDQYVEYQAGSAPLILIAPHGGTLSPATLPDRTCAGCETSNDLNTQELSRAVADSFAAKTGRRPHLVANKLHRRKFDANREVPEATGGTLALERSWRWLHAFIDTAKAAIVRTPGRGLVLDMHGHGHAILRLEIGYLLSANTLRLDDAGITATNAMGQSSIARMVADARAGEPPVALLNGANSLGGLLAAAGVPSVPSPQDRAPKDGELYFTGGYNTQRHGSVQGGTIDAIQIEHNNAGIRDTQLNRERYAGILATALVRYLDRNYGWR
jgi:hypothetical protein